MKTIKYRIGGQEKVLSINKEFLSTALGFVLVALSAIIAFLIKLITVNFDFTVLLSTTFWAEYFTMLFTGYMCLFGLYFIRKSQKRSDPKFLIQRETLKEHKRQVVSSNKITDCQNWLKNVFNYRIRVDQYRGIIARQIEKMKKLKPNEPVYEKAAKGRLEAYRRSRQANIYKSKLDKYNKQEEQRKYCSGQLDICNKHFEIIEHYRHNRLDEVKKILTEIKELDDMIKHKIKHVDIIYNELFNVDIADSSSAIEIRPHEAKFVAKQMLPMVFIGIVLVAILTAIIPQGKAFNWGVILDIVFNLFLLAWNSFVGVNLGNRFMSNLYALDGNRLMISEAFFEDSRITPNLIETIEPDEIPAKTTHDNNDDEE